MALQIDGRQVPGHIDGRIRAALSTGSMPTALQQTADLIAVEAYRETRSTWQSFAAVKSSADFRPTSGIRPSFGGALEELPSGGEIRHGTWGEESVYQWKVSTYAKMLGIDRRSVVDDRMDFFSEVLPTFSRMASRAVANLLYKEFLDNSAFFTGARGNHASGAGTALSITSLGTALALLRNQKDAEGNSIDVQAVTLLVPPALEVLAKTLLNSIELARNGGDQLPTGNAFQGAFKLEVEPRLSNSAFTGWSTTAWYLLGAPADAVAVVGYLNGKDTPTLESFGLDHDVHTLTYYWRCYHDFGAAKGDYRAGVKMAGV